MSDQAVFQAVIDAINTEKPVALATVIRTQGSVPRHEGSKMLVHSDGSIVGTVGGGEVERRVIAEALKVIETGKPRLLSYSLIDPAKGDPGICGGTLEVFVEPILPPPTVLVVGCGHVGRAVAELAKWLGFRVIVTDVQPELCKPNQIEADRYVPCPAHEIADNIEIGRQTYVVVVTRDSALDVAALPGLLATTAPYIGVIGSRRRWATTVKALKEQGITEEQLSRVHSPIGLHIHAETPKEIALSIMAQIVQVRNGPEPNE